MKITLDQLTIIQNLVAHAKETYPHFESPRGQYDITNSESVIGEVLATAQYMECPECGCSDMVRSVTDDGGYECLRCQTIQHETWFWTNEGNKS